jgi:hypothetical protein
MPYQLRRCAVVVFMSLLNETSRFDGEWRRVPSFRGGDPTLNASVTGFSSWSGASPPTHADERASPRRATIRWRMAKDTSGTSLSLGGEERVSRSLKVSGQPRFEGLGLAAL